MEQRLIVRAALCELHLVLAQVAKHLTQARGAERDVIERTGALALVLGQSSQILRLIRIGRARALADVHDIHAAQIQPIHRKVELGVRSELHAEDLAIPVPGLVHVVGQHQEVLDVRERHALAPAQGMMTDEPTVRPDCRSMCARFTSSSR